MSEKALHFDSEFEAIKAKDDELIVEGYFATYDLDKQNERWVPGSWGDAIKAFMANPSRPVLYEHKREYGQFGTVETLEERPGGLWGRMRLPKPAGAGVLSQAWQAVKAGLTKGVSVHAPMLMLKQSDGSALLRPRSIKEMSITPFPINETSVVGVAAKAFADDPDAPAAPDMAAAEVEIREYLDGKLAEAHAELDRQQALIEADAEKAVSQKERDKAASSGAAMADGSFPITHCGKGPKGVGAALSDLGRTNKSRSAVMAHIRKRAKALGCLDKYPSLRGDS